VKTHMNSKNFKIKWIGYNLTISNTLYGISNSHYRSRPTLAKFEQNRGYQAVVTVFNKGNCPVITAPICAGKVSSSKIAELGSKKVMEQIDAIPLHQANIYISYPYFGHYTDGAT
jgi:hypothetical protein